MRTLLVGCLLSLSLVAAPAFAQSQGGDAKGGEVRRDPNGVKGISPYNEHLAKGRTASANGDWAGAVQAFDAAIATDGGRMMAYLLKAQAELGQGDLAAARKAAEEGRAKKGNEATNAKLLFLIADLEERKAAPPSTAEKKSKLSEALRSTWDKVKEGWSAYTSYLTSHTSVPDYKASADERKKQVDARVKREEDYGAVAERIRKAEDESTKGGEGG